MFYIYTLSKSNFLYNYGLGGRLPLICHTLGLNVVLVSLVTKMLELGGIAALFAISFEKSRGDQLAQYGFRSYPSDQTVSAILKAEVIAVAVLVVLALLVAYVVKKIKK